jgi:tetratricopeptide (TPR) repeat protein
LGSARRRLGDLIGADSACREAIRLAPGDARGHINLGNILLERGDFAAAETAYRNATALDPNSALAFTNLGTALNDLDRSVDAADAFSTAVALAPANAEALNAMGCAHLERGKLDEAADLFRRAIAADPSCADAYYNLAEFRDIPMDAAMIAGMEALVGCAGLDREARIKIHFALGDAADRTGDAETAFAHYDEGNTLRRAAWRAHRQAFDAARHRGLAARIAKTFDQSFFSARPWYGLDTDAPVFIVGMPRSGTSLVEQILASHPKVRGAGERPEIAAFAREFARFPEDVAKLTVEAAHAMSVRYFDAVLADGSEQCVIDKMPGNALFLGLVALLFPRARIIHCRRDPRDTGFSIYARNFAVSLPWTADLADIAAVQKTTDDLMAYWATALPLPILSVDYEKLVADLERQARRMVKFLGLDWDAACLDYRHADRAVRTASKWQVRQPISNASVGRWRPYEPFLAPLIDGLSASQFPLERGT